MKAALFFAECHGCWACAAAKLCALWQIACLKFLGASPSSRFADWSWCLHTGTLAPTCWQFHSEGVFPIHAWYVCRPRENSFLTEIDHIAHLSQCIMIHDVWNASFRAVVLFGFTALIWGLQMQVALRPCSVWGCGFSESYRQDGDYWGADDGSTIHGVQPWKASFESFEKDLLHAFDSSSSS